MKLNFFSDAIRQKMMSVFGEGSFRDRMCDSAESFIDVKITAAQLDALNATPVELIAAPGAGKVIVPSRVLVNVDFVATRLELGSGTLDVRYENSSGGLCAQVTNAAVEAAADTLFHAYCRDVVALANKALVAHASADVTAGDSIVYMRIYYRVVTVAQVDPATV